MTAGVHTTGIEPVRILLIDDDEDAYVLTADFLSELAPTSYHLDWIDGFEQGLAAMREEAHDIYLVDYQLGAASGIELVAQARAAGVLLPMILLTGQGGLDVAVDAMKAGAADFLAKDRLSPEGLERALRYALARHTMERQLHQERSLSQAILDTTDALVVMLDPAGTIVSFNRACSNLTGWSEEEALGRNVLELVPEEERDDVRGIIAGADRENEIRTVFENHWLGVDGPRRIQWRNSAMRDRDGNTAYLIGTGTDVTTQRRQERMLHQSAKLAAIGELAGNLAHEFNNPIGIINAKVRLLLDRERAHMNDKIAGELAKVVDQCDRLGRLSKGLLEFSRPGSGERRPTDVRAAIEQSLQLVGDRLERRGVDRDVQLPESPLTVLGNANELQQIFINLLLNALDAMPNGGTLRVTGAAETHGSEPEVVVTVSDTGPGIADEHLERLFEPFFSTKEAAHGTGLGLSICLGIAQGHGGAIFAGNRDGGGATFAVHLPALTDTVDLESYR